MMEPQQRLRDDRRQIDASNPLIVDDDDDTEAEVVVLPQLQWEDQDVKSQVLKALSHMRKTKQFCDVTLQVGKQDYPTHRAVLAAASPYLFELFTADSDKQSEKEEGRKLVYELNGGFDRDALERLIDYAYTGRLEVPGNKVKAVCASAVRLRMDRVAKECMRFLSSNLDISSCLDIRSMRGIARQPALIAPVDEFISDNMSQLREGKYIFNFPRLNIEVLHNSLEEKDAAKKRPLCELVLDWVHGQWLEDEQITIERMTEKHHYLYLSEDNSLSDCVSIEEGSEKDSEIIQDYKKQHGNLKTGKKCRRTSSIKPPKPREMLYSRHINQDDAEEDNDWKVIGVTEQGKSIVAVITIDGRIAIFSIVQRVNRPSSPSSQLASRSLCSSKATTPGVSRPPSIEKDLFEAEPIALMSQAKCAVGAAEMDGKLVVCGGYDRGECLRTVDTYDPMTNQWSSLPAMSTKRGRFGVAIVDNVIYAVAGSCGNNELATVEKLEHGAAKWKSVASLPHPVSNVGVCNFNGKVYCIGGLNGQTGTKHCYAYDIQADKWERIASLHTGRSQAAVAVYEDKLWVVGGCDAWNPLNTTEIYDPLANTWRYGPPLMSPRRGCGLAVRNEQLIVVGGSDGTHSLCTTEVLGDQHWMAGPKMVTRRTNVSLVNLGQRLFAVGGFSGKAFLNTIEYIDNSSDEWTTYFKVPRSISSSGDIEDRVDIGVVDEPTEEVRESPTNEEEVRTHVESSNGESNPSDKCAEVTAGDDASSVGELSCSD